MNWYIDLNFNYSIVTGKSSSPMDNLLVQAGQLSEKPLGESYMSWDRPLHFLLIYLIHTQVIGDFLQDWSMNLEDDTPDRSRYDHLCW